MDLLALLAFLKGLSTWQWIVTVGGIIIAVSQGWLTIQGIQFKKREKKRPMACLHGRSGSCELLRMQMEKAEICLEKVSMAALDHYLVLRKERTGEHVILAMDIEAWCYELTLYRVGRAAKATVRSFFVANHLAAMSEDSFELYMKARTDQVVTEITSVMDKLYFPGSDPSRRELYVYNQDRLMPMLHAAMEVVFREGRKLAIQFAAGEMDKYMERSDEHN